MGRRSKHRDTLTSTIRVVTGAFSPRVGCGAWTSSQSWTKQISFGAFGEGPNTPGIPVSITTQLPCSSQTIEDDPLIEMNLNTHNTGTAYTNDD